MLGHIQGFICDNGGPIGDRYVARGVSCIPLAVYGLL